MDANPGPPDDVLWRRYEESVHDLLKQLDPGAKIVHNEKVRGRLSQTDRQIDVWVVGTVLETIEVHVAIECKRYRRPVSIEVVDQFVGKLLDVGAGIGVLYSYSGFTNSAVARAEAATNPRVLTVAVQTPAVVLRNTGVPGYPASLLVQAVPPLWVEDLAADGFTSFVVSGEWPRSWL
ncbi:restriction endonuclease [Actinoplanes hulinensis]|uniref:Restriction endonuclease n=1 Tax=Actinoplanes hulinensis TaxID=1144547 RepID=A0ABS7AUG4_9ACTN|nr:restriction endonuclease [Actinoplanes hulinensis]MBW6432397.1 restriction endonuclease [Actinoplanes hulinensis]